MLARGILSDAEKYQFDSYNTSQEYGKALYLGIDTNPDMLVQNKNRSRTVGNKKIVYSEELNNQKRPH